MCDRGEKRGGKGKIKGGILCYLVKVKMIIKKKKSKDKNERNRVVYSWGHNFIIPLK